jgi:hypothetical protein
MRLKSGVLMALCMVLMACASQPAPEVTARPLFIEFYADW